MNFVELFQQHTKNYESPSSFWKWSAYTAVAAVMRDNCFRRMGDDILYPNMFTLVVADSAVQRKGHPVKLCEQLVRKINNTKVISGRSSIQGILDALSAGEQDKKTGKVVSGGSALWSAPELSAGIVNDPEAVKILTDIYDFKDEYTSRLRGSGIFRIRNVCLTMFAASNEELLRDIYDSKAIFGGLLGRTFLIKPNEFRPGNSLFGIREQRESFNCMIELLGKIALMKGEFEITPEAESAYNNWYIPFRKSYEHKSDRSGISGRIHTAVVKLSMVLAAITTGITLIEETHIKMAIAECLSLLPNYQGFVMSGGRSSIAEVAALLIEEIWQSKGRMISKADFLSRYIHMVDSELLDRCIGTLTQAELLRMTLDTSSGKEYYAVTDKCRDKFQLK